MYSDYFAIVHISFETFYTINMTAGNGPPTQGKIPGTSYAVRMPTQPPF